MYVAAFAFKIERDDYFDSNSVLVLDLLFIWIGVETVFHRCLLFFFFFCFIGLMILLPWDFFSGEK